MRNRWSSLRPCQRAASPASERIRRKVSAARSEEHTSELQSQSNLVCRLLLEKTKLRHPSSRALSANATFLPPPSAALSGASARGSYFSIVATRGVRSPPPPFRFSSALFDAAR